MGATRTYYDPSMNSNLTGITPYSPTTIEKWNFSFSWRETLPKVVNAGLSLHNYFTNNYQDYMSFKINFCPITTSNTYLCFESHRGAQVLYQTFSIVIITKESDYI